MLDDGRVTDSKGKTVDFKNTVVIMTSNIGSDILLEGYKGGDEIAEDVREKVLARLKSHFRPIPRTGWMKQSCLNRSPWRKSGKLSPN